MPDRKPYKQPSLVKYGQLKDLTTGGTGTAKEGFLGTETAPCLGVLYRFADLVVESDVPLSELPRVHRGSADCLIRIDTASHADSVEDRWDHHWRAADDSIALSCARDFRGYRLGVPGLALFTIEGDGRSIAICPIGEVPQATLEHLLIDQILPRVLTHRGRLVLHAGCVSTTEGAIAFLGRSGAGKSTLCAELASAGYPLLGDDGIMVARGRHGFDATATYPGLRLLPGPLAARFKNPSDTTMVAHYTEKRRVHDLGEKLSLMPGSAPLRALYWLTPGSQVEIAPLPDRDAFLALVQSLFLLHLDDPVRSRALFDGIGALHDAVPVRRLSYPLGFEHLAAVREALENDVLRYGEPACASAS